MSWEEFVRKLTLLVLFDRENSPGYEPKSWNPMSSNKPLAIHRLDRTITTRLGSTQPKVSAIDHKTIDATYLMKNVVQLEDYDPYEGRDFGSNSFVIRAKIGQLPKVRSGLRMKPPEPATRRFNPMGLSQSCDKFPVEPYRFKHKPLAKQASRIRYSFEQV